MVTSEVWTGATTLERGEEGEEEVETIDTTIWCHNNLVPQQNTRPDLGDRAPNVSQHRPGGLIVVPVYN